MNARLRRHTKRLKIQAEIIGLNKAKLIFSLLLKEPASAHVQRLMWLLEALRRAEKLRLEIMEIKLQVAAMGSSAMNLWVLTGDPTGERTIARTGAELKRLVSAINERLKRYQFTPAIRVLEPEPLGLIENKQYLNKTETEEAIAAGWMVEFASNGHGLYPAAILNFRICREQTCQKLFWNEDKKAHYCSPACRKRFYSSNPEHKLKRNERLKRQRREKTQKDKETDAKFFERSGRDRFSLRVKSGRNRRMIQ